MNAHDIVTWLLEDGPMPVRVCARCQQEFGAYAPPNASHGTCRRHYIECFMELDVSQAQAEAEAVSVENGNPNAWCSDLSQSNAA